MSEAGKWGPQGRGAGMESLLAAVRKVELLPGFRVARIAPREGGQLMLEARRGEGGPILRVFIGSIAEPRLATPAFAASLSELGDMHGSTPPDGVMQYLSRRLGYLSPPLLMAFPHLALSGESSRRVMHSIFRRKFPGFELPEPRDRLVLDPQAVASFLAPEIELGGAAFHLGFQLAGIAFYHPGAVARSIDLGALRLDWQRLSDDTRLSMALGIERSIGIPVARLGRLAIGVAAGGRGGDSDGSLEWMSLASWVALVVALKTSPSLEVVVHSRAMDPPVVSVPAVAGGAGRLETEDGSTDSTFLLGSEADCGQQCVFCSLLRYVPPHDAGHAELEAKRLHLRFARAAGVEHVQFEGIDPTAFSQLLPLAESIRQLGFSSFTLTGTGRRFADPEFRKAFLARCPTRTRILVPLYGVDATTHDAVVGRVGAHAETVAAIDGLVADGGSVAVTTVITVRNASSLVPVSAFARQRGLDCFVQLPYPSYFREYHGTYEAAAVAETAVVAAAAAQLTAAPEEAHLGLFLQMGMAITHPCILWSAEQRTGLPFFTASAPSQPSRLAAVDSGGRTRLELSERHADGAATVPCPFADHCSVVDRCSGEMYSSYVDRFGIEEFTAVPADGNES